MTMQRAKFLEDYHRLKAVMGDAQAEAVSTFVSGQLDGNKEDLETTLATKMDLSALELRLNEIILKLHGEQAKNTSETKAELLRWSYVLFITQTTVLIGVMVALLKHFI